MFICLLWLCLDFFSISDQYKAEEAKAKSEGNSSKARRMGRIVTQYIRYQVSTRVRGTVSREVDKFVL